MKILSEAPERLVATDKNPAALIVGGVLGVAGLLMVVLGQNLIAGLVGFLLMAGGVYLIVMRQVRTLIVDKTVGKVSIQARSLLRKHLNEYLFHDIAKVQLVRNVTAATVNADEASSGLSINLGPLSFGGGGRNRAVQRTQLLLVLHNGTTAEVTAGQQTAGWMVMFGGLVPGEDVAQKLAGYVAVPYESMGDGAAVGDVVAEAASAVKATAAVAPAAQPAPASQPAQPAAPAEVVPVAPAPVAPVAPAPAPAAVPPAAEAPAPATPAPAAAPEAPAASAPQPPTNPPAPPTA
jgi:hypothetical protein